MNTKTEFIFNLIGFGIWANIFLFFAFAAVTSAYIFSIKEDLAWLNLAVSSMIMMFLAKTPMIEFYQDTRKLEPIVKYEEARNKIKR